MSRLSLKAVLMFLCLGMAVPCLADGIYTYVDASGRRVFTNVDPNSAAKEPPTTTSKIIPTKTKTRAPSTGVLENSAELQKRISDLADKYNLKKFNLGSEFVRAVIKVESNYNPTAVSNKGALGLMQLMPETARRFGVRNVYDPYQNLDGGIQYLKFLLEMFHGDPNLTLAAYNAGENVVQRLRAIPPYRETQEYVQRVSQILGTSHPIPIYDHSRGKMTYVAWVGGRLKFTNVDPPASAVVFDGYNLPPSSGTP